MFFQFDKIPDAKKYWGGFLAVGVLLIALGALAIGYANWATEVTIIFLGFLLVGGGFVQIVSGFSARKWTGFSISMLLGLLYLIAGGLCILKPEQSALSISFLVGALLLVGGGYRMMSALRFRFDHWGVVLFNGFVAILFGILILADWPESAIWVIGLFVGVDLVLMGGYWVWLSLLLRKS